MLLQRDACLLAKGANGQRIGNVRISVWFTHVPECCAQHTVLARYGDVSLL